MVFFRHHSQNPRKDSLSRCNHASTRELRHLEIRAEVRKSEIDNYWGLRIDSTCTRMAQFCSCPKKEMIGNLVITPAAARGFANVFFLGHLWDILVWSRSSRDPVSFCQVARDHGVEGMSRGRTGIRKGLTTSLVLHLPMAESCTFFAKTLPCGLS